MKGFLSIWDAVAFTLVAVTMVLIAILPFLHQQPEYKDPLLEDSGGVLAEYQEKRFWMDVEQAGLSRAGSFEVVKLEMGNILLVEYRDIVNAIDEVLETDIYVTWPYCVDAFTAISGVAGLYTVESTAGASLFSERANKSLRALRQVDYPSALDNPHGLLSTGSSVKRCAHVEQELTDGAREFVQAVRNE